MALSGSILPRQLHSVIKRDNGHIEVSPRLTRAASALPAEVLSEFETRAEGLTEDEAQARLDEFGPNVVADEARFTRLRLLVKACLNPLVILLSVLATISFATAQTASDDVSGMLMVIMVVLGVSLRFVQEVPRRCGSRKAQGHDSGYRHGGARGKAREIPLAELVPGDIVQLAAGDMIPADLRILSCKDLFLTQASLTGESFPVEKFDAPEPPAGQDTAGTQ